MRQRAHICFAESRIVFPVLVKLEAGSFFIMERISIYIDGANFFYGVKSINDFYVDEKFDFEKFSEKISKGRKLIKVYYYNASLKQGINPEPFKRQQRLFSRLKKANFEVVLCRRQKTTDDDGNDKYKIKGDDIHLAVDMLKDAYENKYDIAVLISGDGDFSPLVEQIKKLGKKVENYHFENSISLELAKVCTKSVFIDKKIVNKFFYRGSEQMTIGDSFNI